MIFFQYTKIVNMQPISSVDTIDSNRASLEVSLWCTVYPPGTTWQDLLYGAIAAGCCHSVCPPSGDCALMLLLRVDAVNNASSWGRGGGQI